VELDAPDSTAHDGFAAAAAAADDDADEAADATALKTVPPTMITLSIFSSCKFAKHSTFLTPTLKRKDFGRGDDLRCQSGKGIGMIRYH